MYDLKAQNYANLIKNYAQNLGFDACGISKAEFLSEQAPILERWLAQDRHGKMAYMANHFDKRLDPRILVEGSKSVISLLFNYYPEQKLGEENAAIKISKYAYGEDYHQVMKAKMTLLFEAIQNEIGDINGRVFVDSAPIMDKVWAEKSGIGWIGKHSNLINRNIGSFFFIGEIILDLELTPDSSMTDYCGTCTKCIDACPTDAIFEPYQVDGSKCISYFTIELKEAIPEEVRGKFENWVFGCDICQDVCPWNRFSKPHKTNEFNLHPDLVSFTNSDWQEITEEVFKEIFKKSALKRTKFEGLKKNIEFVQLK